MHCLIKVGKIDESLILAETLYKSYSHHTMYFTLAGFYSQIHKFHIARKFYLQCIKLDSLNVKYVMAYSQFLRENNRAQESLTLLRQTLSAIRKGVKIREFDLYLIYLELAHLEFSCANYRRSLVLFIHASYLQANFPYNDLIAECFLYFNRYNDALKYAELHLDQWGDNDPDALFTFAKAMAGLGRNEECIDALQKCSDIWGELIITASDVVHLTSLIQNGSIDNIRNTIIQL